MTDFHTHILFDIDDGSKSAEMSIKMLEKEFSDGVDNVVLSPHFDPSKQNIQKFISKRDNNALILKNHFIDKINIKTGAEVIASPFLTEVKGIESLCIEGTRVMLIELPLSNFSVWIENLVYNLQLMGITPVLAHIERYKQLRDFTLLKKLENLGALMQINLSVFDSPSFLTKRFIKKAVKQNLVHIIGTDCHSDNWRKPQYKKGVADAQNIIGKEDTCRLLTLTDSVFETGRIPYNSLLI